MRRLAPDGLPHPPEAYVFGDKCGGRLLEHKTAWGNACRRAGIVGLHCHDLRREAGSRLLEAGVPLHVVSAWLGHASVNQTATYLSINLPQLHDAKAKLEAALTAAAEAARLAAEQAAREAAARDAACNLLAISEEGLREAGTPTHPTYGVH